MDTVKTADDYARKALALWYSFDADTRAGVCFGLYPFGTLQAAGREGFKVGKMMCALYGVAEEATLKARRVA